MYPVISPAAIQPVYDNDNGVPDAQASTVPPSSVFALVAEIKKRRGTGHRCPENLRLEAPMTWFDGGGDNGKLLDSIPTNTQEITPAWRSSLTAVAKSKCRP